MSGQRELLTRMKSIKDTMKITNAMFMISSVKLNKARQSLADTSPYFLKLQLTIERILRHLPEMHSPYFDAREEVKEKKKGYIIISADKGLCGAYNHNIFTALKPQLLEAPNAKLFVLGELGRHYFESKGVTVDTSFQYVVQEPTISRARTISEFVLAQFLNYELDEIDLVYTRMINAVQTEPVIVSLLPLHQKHFQGILPQDVRLEELALLPNADAVMDGIVPNYLTGFIYGALVTSYCCEQTSRMRAMEAATKNATDMLSALDLLYHRSRQTAITQEITEVTGGAKALKKKVNRL